MVLKDWVTRVATAAAVAAAVAVNPATAAESTYRVVGLVDFVGPYADIAAPVFNGREAVIRWWNAEIGKDLGINLTVKNFDTRSDPAQAASLWPSISAEKPIALMSFGASDAMPLRDRLAEAKVPLFFGGAVPIPLWLPDAWVFALRPTYAHEAGAFFDLIYRSEKRSKPIKVAVLSSEAVPLYIEMVKGVVAYAKAYNRISVVETIWDAPQPTDLTAQMQRVVKSGAEYLVVQTNTAAVIAAQRGLQALGANIPIIVSSHNGLLASARALNDMKALENSFEVHVLPMPAGETEPKRFYDMLVSKYGYKNDWTPLAAHGIAQGLLTVRAIEMAAKRYGGSGLDGTKVREALTSGTVKAGFGYAPDVNIDRRAPFPVTGLTVNVGMIKDGKYVLKHENIPVPELEKW